MNPHLKRRTFLDRTGARLSRTAGQWLCATPDGRLRQVAPTPHAAVDALRATVFSPLMRAPISITRWLAPL